MDQLQPTRQDFMSVSRLAAIASLDRRSTDDIKTLSRAHEAVLESQGIHDLRCAGNKGNDSHDGVLTNSRHLAAFAMS
jgi:hypothetical protein